MFLSLKTLYRKRTVIWPFYFYTIIRTLSKFMFMNNYIEKFLFRCYYRNIDNIVRSVLKNGSICRLCCNYTCQTRSN
ncbi:hypothetical protein CWR44_11005 [Staphylococcus haemolyticus]|nr:hypothetical protein CWR44_11005 [Staphylococcus haemolyticus]